MDPRFHIFAVMASPALDRLYPRYSFYRRLSGLQDQSGQKVVKNAPLRHPGSKPGRPARNLVPCRLNSIYSWCSTLNIFVTGRHCLQLSEDSFEESGIRLTETKFRLHRCLSVMKVISIKRSIVAVR